MVSSIVSGELIVNVDRHITVANETVITEKGRMLSLIWHTGRPPIMFM